MTDDHKDVELHERMARIEQQVEHIDQKAEERYDHLKSIESKLDTLTSELQQYRGMVGAILLVGTTVITFFKLFWHDIMKFIK
jgi:peptidoglycan hydrolase CwlO-like protein